MSGRRGPVYVEIPRDVLNDQTFDVEAGLPDRYRAAHAPAPHGDAIRAAAEHIRRADIRKWISLEVDWTADIVTGATPRTYGTPDAVTAATPFSDVRSLQGGKGLFSCDGTSALVCVGDKDSERALAEPLLHQRRVAIKWPLR